MKGALELDLKSVAKNKTTKCNNNNNNNNNNNLNFIHIALFKTQVTKCLTIKQITQVTKSNT